jgi:hypothetical protein
MAMLKECDRDAFENVYAMVCTALMWMSSFAHSLW